MKVNKILFLFLFSLLCVFMISCKEENEKSLKLSLEDITLDINEVYTIDPLLENIDTADIVYSCSDNEILMLTENKVKALKEGICTVTISTKDNKYKANLKVIVNPREVFSTYKMEVGGKLDLINEKYNKNNLKLENNNIISLDGITVTALAVGKANVIYDDGTETYIIEIIVKEKLLKVSCDKPIYVGKTVSLEANYDLDKIEFECSDYDVVKIENGAITGLKEGEFRVVAHYEDEECILNMKVIKQPIIEIKGNNKLFISKTMQLDVNVLNYEGDEKPIFKTSNKRIATVDSDGVVKGLSEGNVTITVQVLDVTEDFNINVAYEKSQVTFDFNGGVSKELFEYNGAVSTFSINSYNESNFWSAYTDTIFLNNKSTDAKPTFSDRIYIGKNPDNGFYEIKNIIMSGSSSWADGAEYVIIISNSHKNKNSLHKLVQNLKVGYYCFFENDLDTISKLKPCNCSFYDNNVKTEEVIVTSNSYKKMFTPTRIGANFLGWYDGDTLVSSIKASDINHEIYLKAKWEFNNPVTEINVTNIKDSFVCGEELKLDASVAPSDAFNKTIYYTSSNQDIFTVSKDGKLVFKNPGKAVLTLQDYTKSIERKFDITVYSIDQLDVVFNDEFKGFLEINETCSMNVKFFGNKEVHDIIYELNNDVLSITNDGKVTALKEGVCDVTIKYKDTDISIKVIIPVVKVSNETKMDKLINLISANNFSNVDCGNACLYNDGTERNYKATYGSVNRYLFDSFSVNTQYKETARNNNNGHKSRSGLGDIEFVTVHDTATLTGTAANIASNMASGETSIHYVTGDKQIYAVVPEEFIAYHAGDGTGVKFYWTNTKVEAKSNTAPVYDVVFKNGNYYYSLNGVTTDITVPSGDGQIVPSKSYLSHLGPVWKVQDGYYYIGNTWYCKDYRTIGSKGGNNNSIGIEMCVNTTGDIYDTWQRTAKLVSDILIRNNLDITRVKMHNTWTGKNCPQCLIAGGYWDDFMKLVEVEYTIMKDYKDFTITMKSNNPDIVSNTGRVINAPKTTTQVSYDVTVSDGVTSKTVTLYSVIKGSSTWVMYSGSYKASVIWNNGKFSL